MEARLARAALVAAALLSLGAQFRTPNFVVDAPTPELARQVGRSAEKFRKELAIQWLGKAMPKWSRPCPIKARVAPNLGAGGVTSFLFDRGEVYGWRMNIQGPQDRLLDSVLPHEVTHTIFASHFRQPLPRWADEGACTTVEHESERAKQQQLLIQFLKTGRGIAFTQMFALKEYPSDVMPLYSQGFSLASFLIDQGGRKKFLSFLGEGLQDERWPEATQRFYGYPSLAALQHSWLDWVKQGSPRKEQAPEATEETGLLASKSTKRSSQPDVIYRGQSEDPPSRFTGNLVDVQPTPHDAQQLEIDSADGAEQDPPIAKAAHDSVSKWVPRLRRSQREPGSNASNTQRGADVDSHAEARSDEAPPRSAQLPRRRTRRTLLEWDRDEDSGAGSAEQSPLYDASAGEVRVLR